MSPVDCDADVAVVGAGVVGLAVAAELAEAGRAVVVLERHPGPGRETSSRNSEVIHSGLYYPTGSLQARLCVAGNRLLYDFCERFAVAHRRIEKLVVAVSDEETPELDRLLALGTANGVPGLRLLGRPELARLEPSVSGVGALYSPTTGIVDSHGLIKALEARARAAGAQILYRCEVQGAEQLNEAFALFARNPSGTERLGARFVVNSAGLEADRVSAMVGIDAYRLWWCKGDYFSVGGAVARSVKRLVYPIPQRHFLGVHVTLDLAGRMRLGPDAAYVNRGDAPSYTVDSEKVRIFYESARQLLPALKVGDLQPDLAGMRPKLQGPQDPWRDFTITEESGRGCSGWINLVGVESPGLTSCLAIGKEVSGILQRMG